MVKCLAVVALALIVGMIIGVGAIAPVIIREPVRIEPWTSPNKADRCYVAYYADGRRADIACIAIDRKGD